MKVYFHMKCPFPYNIPMNCIFPSHRYTCRGLFERHKLLFSFHMCAKILEAAGKLNMDEYNFFLRGGIVSLNYKIILQCSTIGFFIQQLLSVFYLRGRGLCLNMKFAMAVENFSSLSCQDIMHSGRLGTLFSDISKIIFSY